MAIKYHLIFQKVTEQEPVDSKFDLFGEGMPSCNGGVALSSHLNNKHGASGSTEANTKRMKIS